MRWTKVLYQAWLKIILLKEINDHIAFKVDTFITGILSCPTSYVLQPVLTGFVCTIKYYFTKPNKVNSKISIFINDNKL